MVVMRILRENAMQMYKIDTPLVARLWTINIHDNAHIPSMLMNVCRLMGPHHYCDGDDNNDDERLSVDLHNSSRCPDLLILFMSPISEEGNYEIMICRQSHPITILSRAPLITVIIQYVHFHCRQTDSMGRALRMCCPI